MFSRYLPIISILFLILLFLGGFFLWWPEFQQLSDLKTELEIKKLEVKQKEEYPKKLIALSGELKEYSEELDKINSALPKDPSIPSLFTYIQKATSENGLILESLGLSNVASSKNESGVKNISFTVSASGSYPAFKNFLSVIYKNARLINVNSIKFSSPSEESDLFAFDMTFTTYSLAEVIEEIPAEIPANQNEENNF